MATKKKHKHVFTMDQITDAMDSMSGYCTACGEERDSCEPDARNYECDACGEKMVFGAEELVIMGLVY